MAPAALRRGVRLELEAETQTALVAARDRNQMYQGLLIVGTSAVTVSVHDACLRIDDCGPGLPLDQRDVVFARFRRGAWSAHVGSGLGLAIVARACTRLNASAHISSSPSGGARFEVQFDKRLQTAANSGVKQAADDGLPSQAMP